jgi:hypothetical protein
MKALRWLLPLLSLLAVLWLTWWDTRGGGTGPGPIHSAHASLPAIDGGTNCDACHRQGAGIDAVACTRCHTAIAESLQAQTGLHGKLVGDTQKHCELCHSDHHGDTVPLIAPFAFARAGVAEPNAYDHAHVVFTLTGAHKALACTKCHANAEAKQPPAGGRFLGLSQRCTSCHDDAHRGAFGSDCASCHGQDQPWRSVPQFRHATFPLADAHAKVACAQCHAKDTLFDVAAERVQAQPVRTCAQCHADPHADPRVGVTASAAANAIRLANTADCARCHAATTWAAARPTSEQHAELGFPLRADHATTDCANCHGDAKRPPRWRGAAPALAACAVCHPQHPHGAPLLAAATAAVGPANGCADCHRDDHADFRAGTMTAAQHAATGFRLELPHAEVACAKCHTGGDWAARYPGRDPNDCRRCHDDVHQAQFAHDPRYAQCSACHAGAHFLPSTFGLAAHARSAFPLTGAHEAVACTACHRDVVGEARTFHGTKARCSDCHQDVHRGAFDQPGRPREVAGRSDCARCHDTNAFAPVVADFDHATWTGHRLLGAHQALPCAQCHAPSGKPNGPRLGPAAGTTCASCHQDPHAGQFAVGTATDCRQCHTETKWQELVFDHQRDSKFALDDTHRALDCAKCHQGYRVGERTIVRYKPLGTKCGDCHQLGAGQKVIGSKGDAASGAAPRGEGRK